MLSKIARKVFGSRNDRYIKQLRKRVELINALETDIQKLSDDELKDKTNEFKQRISDGETLDSLLNEAFAVCREASLRILKMRHYDAQLIGGIILNENKITEMKTGEGKTLVATLAIYLNALTGKGVHLVTVNDYLAERDAAWMSQLYGFLGLSTGVVLSTMDYDAKREAYKADITYGTNNQFGFDYMHDNLTFTLEERVQRELNFAIVDEVDSILIDEARTPLIISGQASDSSELYTKINVIIPSLKKVEEETEDGPGPGDFTIDEKTKQTHITEQGHETIENLLVDIGLLTEGESLYDTSNIMLVHHLNAALRAHALYQRDVDYLIDDDGQVVIIDEFTGRTMAGRRWSEGLHQAIEAKEGVDIQNENQTIASISFQNYFRLYSKLAGMTGTADTEAYEFHQIYGLEVIVVPTEKPMVRIDNGDLIYLTAREKYNAIVEDIQGCVERKQPVLVGTTTVETSEYLSSLLKKDKIKHEILNAKQHEREAKIIADAGKPGSVTIATNMAGRGTDIVLGGNIEVELKELADDEEKSKALQDEWKDRHQAVLDSGGLHIIGTERHESRRIDNQLRGRSGRQGDKGSTRFYLSMEDNLMRIFASDKVSKIMQKLGMEEGEAIEHPWVSKAIENAQRKVETHNFDMRKHLLEYDDVANDQRKVIYKQRNDLLHADNISDAIVDIRNEVIADIFYRYLPQGSLDEQWDVPNLEKALDSELGGILPISDWIEADDDLSQEDILERIQKHFADDYALKVELASLPVAQRFEKEIMLMVIDRHWKEHLSGMDFLRQGIGLRGYAQKNPIQEYKKESFEMFSEMLNAINFEAISIISKVQVESEQDVDALEMSQTADENIEMQHNAADNILTDEIEGDVYDEQQQPFVRKEKKVGRNEPCWCGSGKKFKQCHGKL